MVVQRLGKSIYSAISVAIILSMVISSVAPRSANAASLPAQTVERSAAPAPSQPKLVFTKAATHAVDVDGDGLIEPGDTVRYTLQVTNNGSAAEDVVLNDVLDPSLSLVPGSIETTPVVVDQSVTTQEDISLPITLTGSDGDGDEIEFTVPTPPTHGMLSGTGSSLTYSPNPDYNGSDPFTFQGCDTAAPSNCDTGTVSIEVTPVNDAPSFTAGLDQVISEDSGAQTVVAWATSISAGPTDEAGQSLTFQVTGNTNSSLFAVAPAVSPAGDLTYTPAADTSGVATITLTLQDDGGVADGGVDTSPTQTFQITVSGVNDPPVVNSATFTLNENSPISTIVDTVKFTDPDPGQGHTLAITDGNTSGAFSIDSTTGTISVADSGALDFETTPTFTLTVEVSDHGTPPLADSAVITVNLKDLDEVPLVHPGTFSIPENSPAGTDVGTVTYSNKDAGQTHTFRISAGNNSAFAIDPESGKITISSPLGLDFEATPVISLTVEVADSATPPNAGTATITINLTDVNEAPIVDGYTFSLAENSPAGTSVGTATYADAEGAQNHIFSISKGNDTEAFVINPSTGVITVGSPNAINYETNPSFSLTVRVTDDGTPAQFGENTITINLNDINEAPTIYPATFSIKENSPNGTPVEFVTYSDPDPSQTHTFAITAGDAAGAFAINASTGLISVAKSTALDFESDPVFELTVRITDSGDPALSASGPITIQVEGVNESPVLNTATFTIPENSINSTIVGTVTAVDPDAGQALTYSIVGGNASGAFSIGASTGIIRVASVAVLDFETTPTFTLSVRATDNGTPDPFSDTATIIVNLQNVNDAPVVTPPLSPFSLNENSANGTVVGAVASSDQDPGQTGTYAITLGNTGDAFAIDPITGRLTIASPAAIDYETNPTFSLTVQVTDNGSPTLSGSATITVNLVNLNEAPVVSPTSFSLPENSPNGTSVGTVGHTDPDTGQTHTLSITDGNTGGAFSINSSTGTITVAAVSAVNFEATPVFSLTIQVTDNGSPVLSGTTTITINLTDVNEAPVVQPESYETVGNTLLEVSQTASAPAPSLFVHGNLLANDTDPDQVDSITAAFVSAPDGAAVVVKPDGTFTYQPAPGATGTRTFQYQVTDKGGLSTQATASIIIKGMVWYVKNDSPAGGLGRSSDPFDTLAEAQAASQAGDTIYVYAGNGTISGQNQGISLKNNQRLIGSGVALDVPASVNNGPNPTPLLAAGTKPRMTNTAVGGDGVRANNASDIEIRGLDISGNVNGVDITTSGAMGGAVTIQTNTVSAAGQEGIDINAGGTVKLTVTILDNLISSTGNGLDVLRTAGLLQLNFSNNVGIFSAGSGVVINGAAADSTTITGFSGNSVNGNTTGTGISITSATFDATPGGAFDQVSGGSTAIGASGNGVGAAGFVLSSVKGNLNFDDLDIYADGGGGLSVAGVSPAPGMTFSVKPSVATISATGGPAVDISTATIALPLSRLTSSSSPTTGVSLVQTAGIFSAPAGSTIATSASATGPAFKIDGGNPVVTYDGTLANSKNRSVLVTNLTSNASVDFNGSITDAGSGILLSNNVASALIRFDGGMTLTTGVNQAFTATSGGSLAVTGAANTLTTTTATALDIRNTTITSDYLTFRSISANGATNGIYLDTTGTNGGLVVTGVSTTANSGGTLQNLSGDCVVLKSTKNVSLANLKIDICGQMGIRAETVAGFQMTNSQVLHAGNGNDEYGISFDQITGNVLIQNSTIANMEETGIRLHNTSGTLDMSLLNTTISDNNPTSGYGEDGFQFQLEGTAASYATARILVDGSTFTRLQRDGIDGLVMGYAQGDLTVRGNTQFTQGSGFGGVNLASSDNAITRLDLTGNTFQNNVGTAVNLVSTGTASLHGRVQNNTISHPALPATLDNYGIRLSEEDNSNMTVEVTGNTISNTAYAGLQALARLATTAGSLHLTIKNNHISTPNLDGYFGAEIRQQSPGNQVCLNSGTISSLGANTFTGKNIEGMRVSQTGAGVFQLEGWKTTTHPTAKEFLQAVNPGTTVLSSGVLTPTSSGPCRTPSLPGLPSGMVMQENNSGTSLVSSAVPAHRPGRGLAMPIRPLQAPQTNANDVALTLALLPPGKTVQITFDVIVSVELPEGVYKIANQADLSGSNFTTLLSDDPSTQALGDPTVTQIYRTPLGQPENYSTFEETPLAVSAPGVLSNDLPSDGYTLTASKFSDPASGILDFHGDGSFTYTPDASVSGKVTFQYIAHDGVSDSQPTTVTIDVVAVNDAPVLENAGALALAPISQDPIDNPGTLVKDILTSAGGDPITDSDPNALEGIAVIGVDNANGVWQYSQNGVDWLAFSSSSSNQARLLASDVFTRVRFVPAAGWNGTVDPGLTFHAWDRTSGVQGETADVTIRGGDTAFSLAAETAAITVVKENDVTLAVSAPLDPVIAGTELTFVLAIHNTGPSLATDLVVTSLLPPGLSFVSGSPTCSLTGNRVTCNLASLAADASANLSITVRIAQDRSGSLASTFEVTAAEPDRDLTNNTADASITVVPSVVAYDSDDGFGDQWNPQTTTTSPCGEAFLGEFGNQTVTLTLSNLPVHTQAYISFDLYILRSWDGSQVKWPAEFSNFQPQGVMSPDSIVGPDRWQLKTDGQTRLDTTFSNWASNAFRQAYPGTYPAGSYPAQTGASQINSLCYSYFGAGPMDSVYKMFVPIDHAGSTLQIDFAALGLQSLADESWGLDNIKVVLSGGADLLPIKLYLPLIH